MPKRFGICNAVIAFVGRAESRIFIGGSASNRIYPNPQCSRLPPRRDRPYILVEWVTISAPHSKGRQLTGVAKVLSTISGTPWLCAAAANFSKSSTVSAGFATVSPNTAFVFGRKAASSSFGAVGRYKCEIYSPFFSLLRQKGCMYRRKWLRKKLYDRRRRQC